MQCDIYSGELARLRADLLVLVCFEEQRPLSGLAAELDWFFSGLFSRVLMQRPSFGRVGDQLLVPTTQKLQVPKTLLLGMGARCDYNEDVVQAVSEALCVLIPRLGVRDCAFELSADQAENVDDEVQIKILKDSFIKAGISEHFQLTFVSQNKTQASVLLHKIRSESLLVRAPSQILSAATP